MSKKDAAPEEAELDEHGLVIHKYVSTVLVVVPPEDYAETTLRYARSALFNVHVGTPCVSTTDDGLLPGTFQDELQADFTLEEANMADHAGVVFCGGPGAVGLAENPDAQRLAREATEAGKLVGAWGHASLILARADVVRKRKVTGDPSTADALRRAGARYTGHQLQVDGTLVTAFDDAAGFRFGKALVQLVGIR